MTVYLNMMIIRKEIVFLFFKKLETSWKTERFFKSVKTDKKKSLSSKKILTEQKQLSV